MRRPESDLNPARELFFAGGLFFVAQVQLAGMVPTSKRATLRNHQPNDTMTSIRTFDLAYYIAQVIKTRAFGHTYVHAGGRAQFDWNDITFYVTGYGRSLQSGGHKYRVLAYRCGKPVKTAELRTLA